MHKLFFLSLILPLALNAQNNVSNADLSKKLDLILTKVGGLEQRVSRLESDNAEVKKEVKQVSVEASDVQDQLYERLNTAHEELSQLKTWKKKTEDHISATATKMKSLQEQLKAKSEENTSSLEANECLEATINTKEDDI